MCDQESLVRISRELKLHPFEPFPAPIIFIIDMSVVVVCCVLCVTTHTAEARAQESKKFNLRFESNNENLSLSHTICNQRKGKHMSVN